MCNGNAITNDLMGKIVCDVPANGNVFLEATVWDVYTKGNVQRGLTVWDVLMTGNDFSCIILFFSTTVRISVFECSPVAHDLILPSVCVPGGHIPDGFWVVWEGPPIAVTHYVTVPNAVVERG